MRKTVTHLADGRELIYFDESSDAVRQVEDRRRLPPLESASELRYDPLLDEWVGIAAHRQARTHLPPTDECPLCPSTPDRMTEIPASTYDVVVFENRFPSMSRHAEQAALVAPTLVTPIRPATGRCEVVCFTSDHDTSFAQLPPERVRTVLAAQADRTAELSALPDVEQVFVFENRGAEIGVTLSHPHGQIYAYPFVPPRTRTMLEVARRHTERTGRILLADVLAAEIAAEIRVIVAGDYWTAYVPAFARWPFEVHITPHRHVGDITELTEQEGAEFAVVYLDVLGRLDRLFGAPMPYISAWHQAPPRHPDRDLAYLHLQLTSPRRTATKLKYLAGSESAMGCFVNDVPPETAARMLKDRG